MTARSLPRRKAALITSGYSDETGPRIKAYLAKVKPTVVEGITSDRPYQNGLALIEQMAQDVSGMNTPILELHAHDYADVLSFVSRSMPQDSRTWCNEPSDAPSHIVGQMLVLQAVENALRDLGNRPNRDSEFQATICLSQAIAVLDLVTQSLSSIDGFPDMAESHTIGQCVYSAIADIKRAKDVLDPGGAEVTNGREAS